MSDIVKEYQYIRSTSQFRSFCDRAERQNPNFPQSEIERMSIAQHYGVDTPLLDWSQNIFTAIFFAVKGIISFADYEKNPKIYMYHILDERLFKECTANTCLSDTRDSLLIKPAHFDRRIERQRGYFSFHPHPSHNPKKIPVNIIVLKEHFILKLMNIMEGLGFTEDYYFPDYAGIANCLTNETSL